MALTRAHEIQLVESIKDHKLYIFSDSLSSLQSLKIEKSQYRQDLVHQILKIHDKLYTLGVQTEIIWVPSHVGIHGNEIADLAAKIGLLNCPQRAQQHTIGTSECNTLIRAYINKQWQELWDNAETGRWLHEIQPTVSRQIISYSNNRKIDKVLTRLILGKTRISGDVAQINKNISELCTHCDMPNTTNHYLTECRLYDGERRELLKK
jgi:hypothetical protein